MTILVRPLDQLVALWRYYVAIDHDEAAMIAQRLARAIEVKRRFERLRDIEEALREVG